MQRLLNSESEHWNNGDKTMLTCLSEPPFSYSSDHIIVYDHLDAIIENMYNFTIYCNRWINGLVKLS